MMRRILLDAIWPIGFSRAGMATCDVLPDNDEPSGKAEENKDSADFNAKYTNYIAQHRELVLLKASLFPWMYDVSKCAPQEALRDLDKAYKNFFSRLKTGEKPGFPRFKKRGVNDSFRLTGSIRVNSRSIQLPRLGKVRTKESTTKFNGRILSATIRREADRWFVSLSVERSRPDSLPVVGPIVGVDLGFTTFATISTQDGGKVEKIVAPRPLKRRLERLAFLQRRHARKQKGSNNHKVGAMYLARLHLKIRNIRTNFMHKLTTRLAKTKSAIVIEDLCVKSLQKGHFSKSVADLGLSDFRRMLTYKTIWYGSKLVIADRFFPSSKLCSTCGKKKESLSLSEREWTCAFCGAVHDRDVNAGKNLARLGGLTTESSSGSHAHGETTAEPSLTSVILGRRPRRSGKNSVAEV